MPTWICSRTSLQSLLAKVHENNTDVDMYTFHGLGANPSLLLTIGSNSAILSSMEIRRAQALYHIACEGHKPLVRTDLPEIESKSKGLPVRGPGERLQYSVAPCRSSAGILGGLCRHYVGRQHPRVGRPLMSLHLWPSHGPKPRSPISLLEGFQFCW